MVDEACLCLPAGTHLIQASRPYGKNAVAFTQQRRLLKFSTIYLFIFISCVISQLFAQLQAAPKAYIVGTENDVG